MDSNQNDLIARLKSVSPLPNDSELGNEEFDEIFSKWEEVIEVLQDDFRLEYLKPILESFGEGTGFGVYWTCVHKIEACLANEAFDLDSYVSELIPLLKHPNTGTREWSLELIGRLIRGGSISIPAELRLLIDDTSPIIRERVEQILSSE